MQKQIVLLFLCSILAVPTTRADYCRERKRTQIDCCECKSTSRTFFSVRPLYQIDSPEYESLFYDRMNARQDGHHGALQFTVFGSTSTNCGSLASYFSPFCKAELIVEEVQTNRTDILASEFGIVTNSGDFSSVISFAPKQTSAGVGISYKQAFGKRHDGREFWVGASMPIMRVSNNFGLTETITNNGGGVSPAASSQAIANDALVPVANMTQALNNPAWNYGKIPLCTQHKTGVADITLQVGYLYLNKPEYQVESYVGVLIPTGNTVKALTLFEPMIGHNKHAGLIVGNDLDVEVWHNDCGAQLWMHLHTHGLFLLSRKEKRMIDVKYKPWSRYMQLYANQEQAETAAATDNILLYTPGVNIFTRDVCVRPGFLRSFNTAFLGSKGNFEGEVGYNFFSRPAECVQLVCPWIEGPAFKSQITAGSTNGFITINNDPATDFACTDLTIADYADNIIKASDLDISSAEHPSMITHTVYATLGYRWDGCQFPALVGTGASYEFSLDNSGLSRIVFWVKGGFSF